MPRKSAFPRNLIAACIGYLIGVPPARRPDVERALLARFDVRYVASIFALRILRAFGGATDRGATLAAPAPAAPSSLKGAQDAAAAREDPTMKHPGDRGGAPPGRVPAVPDSPVPRPFPRHIFQTWKSKVEFPDNYARWSVGLKATNADFEYFLWDDADNRRFIADFYPWFLDVYDAYPREIFRVDAVRYFFLYQFGGVYLDMDTECLRPLAPVFASSADVWLGRMGDDPDFPHSIPNAIMASRPRQEFWLLAMHLLVENAKGRSGAQAQVLAGPEAMTGPVVLKNTYDAYVTGAHGAMRRGIDRIAALLPESLRPEPSASRIELLPADCWYPMNWSNIVHSQLLWEIANCRNRLGDRAKRWMFPRSYLVTYWTHSWKASK
jgi:mannosyltransferase OCH1-like enzyme